MGKEEEIGLESTESPAPGEVAEAADVGAEAADAGAEAGNGGAEAGNGPETEETASGEEPAARQGPNGPTDQTTEDEQATDGLTDQTPEDDQATEDEHAKLADEVRLYRDRWVRLAAEFDNYKKRTGREYAALVRNAGESLITELLPILDNIERALQAPQTSEETRSFAQGFEMIRQQFLEKLEKAGMKEIPAEGNGFDPTMHEAVMAVENGDHPADTVINVVEKGYTLNEKVLRAAKVIVTRPPAEAPAKSADQAEHKEGDQTAGS